MSEKEHKRLAEEAKKWDGFFAEHKTADGAVDALKKAGWVDAPERLLTPEQIADCKRRKNLER